MGETRYFTVPIEMLRGLISGEKDIRQFAQDVVNYSLYYHAKHSPYGDEGEEGGYNSIETQVTSAANFLHVSIGNMEKTVEEGERLYSKYQRKLYCGINTETLWDYNDNPKNTYQIALFCAFCAVRSIIGKTKYKKTNKSLIVARMFGYNSHAELVASTPNPTARGLYKSEMEQRKRELEERERYLKRYHFDKVLTDLELSWGLKRYADHVRGMFISFDLDYGELAVINDSTKKITKINQLKEKKKQARLAVKTQVERTS